MLIYNYFIIKLYFPYVNRLQSYEWVYSEYENNIFLRKSRNIPWKKIDHHKLIIWFRLQSKFLIIFIKIGKNQNRKQNLENHSISGKPRLHTFYQPWKNSRHLKNKYMIKFNNIIIIVEHLQILLKKKSNNRCCAVDLPKNLS